MKRLLLLIIPILTGCAGPVATIGYNVTTETRPDGTVVVAKSPDMKSQRLLVGATVTTLTNSPLFGVASTVAGELGDAGVKVLNKPIDAAGVDSGFFSVKAVGAPRPIPTPIPYSQRR